MDETLKFLLVSLTVWRITSLLVREDGPFDVLAYLRRIIGVRYNEYSQPIGGNVIAKAFVCVWCLSFWVGLIAAAVFYNSVYLHIFILYWFSLSASAIIIDRIVIVYKNE